MPVALFHWEGPPGEEGWVDFVTPAPCLFAASNVAILALVGGCSVQLIFWLVRRDDHLNPQSRHYHRR